MNNCKTLNFSMALSLIQWQFTSFKNWNWEWGDGVLSQLKLHGRWTKLKTTFNISLFIVGTASLSLRVVCDVTQSTWWEGKEEVAERRGNTAYGDKDGNKLERSSPPTPRAKLWMHKTYLPKTLRFTELCTPKLVGREHPLWAYLATQITQKQGASTVN